MYIYIYMIYKYAHIYIYTIYFLYIYKYIYIYVSFNIIKNKLYIFLFGISKITRSSLGRPRKSREMEDD